VCVWRYILQNYNYKLHFQNLSTYHIPHVSIETLAAENLDVCTACDRWDSNIQLTMVKDRRPGPGMPFLYIDTCAEGEAGGGVIYFCQGFLPCMMPSMDGRGDGWMEKASRPRRSLLYVSLQPHPQKKTGNGNCKYVGTTNSKPPGRIIMFGQSKAGSRRSQIIFIALFSSRCTAVLRLLPPASAKLTHPDTVLQEQNYFPESFPIYTLL
jgi:hypothetical protein